MSNPTWGLQREITPHLGARLVQEGNHTTQSCEPSSLFTFLNFPSL